MTVGPTVWRTDAEDEQGALGVRFTDEGDRLAVFLEMEDGRAVGVALDQAEVQRLRHAVTGWLVEVTPTVTRS